MKFSFYVGCTNTNGFGTTFFNFKYKANERGNVRFNVSY